MLGIDKELVEMVETVELFQRIVVRAQLFVSTVPIAFFRCLQIQLTIFISRFCPFWQWRGGFCWQGVIAQIKSTLHPIGDALKLMRSKWVPLPDRDGLIRWNKNPIGNHMGEHTLFALDQIPPEMMWPEPHLQRSKPGTSRQKHQNPKCLEVLNAGDTRFWFVIVNQTNFSYGIYQKVGLCSGSHTAGQPRNAFDFLPPPPCPGTGLS